MGKFHEIRLKIENALGKFLGWIFIYVFVVFGLALAIRVTQWLLQLLGVM